MAGETVLVTGGAGYIGSHTVWLLQERGYSVVVLDDLSAGHRAAVHPAATFVEGNIKDEALVKNLLTERKVSGVIHFAAQLSVPLSVADPLLFWRENVYGTECLLRAMRSADVTRFVFSSTCATYGNPTEVPVPEGHAQNPVSPYGATKLAVERMLAQCADSRAYDGAWKFGAVALRYFNACGAHPNGLIGEDHTPEIHIIPSILEVALGKRECIKIFGTDYPTTDGTCVRDYVHVMDLADAHHRSLSLAKPNTFSAFNVGSGNGHSVREVVEACRKVTGHPIPAEEYPRRPGDPAALYARSGLREHGWVPEFTSLDGIIETAWRWHKSHPTGYQK